VVVVVVAWSFEFLHIGINRLPSYDRDACKEIQYGKSNKYSGESVGMINVKVHAVSTFGLSWCLVRRRPIDNYVFGIAERATVEYLI